ncbi:SNF2-related protein [Staphylospora marina]|uniref:SNF2-related protein n=1 Tax=Staphylospora marina TaxID=2490858 RepID=UPI000F5C125F|nr:SNF2-related protein [Staphylospora marina]
MRILPIRFDREWLKPFSECVRRDTGWSCWERFQLALEAAEAEIVPTFESIQSLKQIQGFEPLPHQINAVSRVIHEMRGRAILADEVGLGKTIEAGLILKEYLLRGLVKKALILVPSSLVLQWTRELNQKFQIPAMAQKQAWMWDKYDILVASLDTAKRDPHREIILSREYDMLIVDEAHKLKNRKTKSWQFINGIRKKYCLLLTATPVQNEMKELFNLVSLLKPGILGNEARFRTDYVAGKRQAKNEHLLREEISKVLIRNRRKDSNLNLTKRLVKTVPVELSPEERALYDGITAFIRDRSSAGADLAGALSLFVLQKEVCSSRDAVFHTLFKLFQRREQGREEISPEVAHLVELLRSIRKSSKVDAAVRLIRELSPEKVVLFTEYRATQDMLIRELNRVGIKAVPFRGGFNRNKKDWMMELFQKRAQVLVATEAGGEGINLQFCHHMINFDMPWNPMRVEQRIGRIHRLGQKNDVHIYNFCTLGTIEEHIIWLLHEKIRLFESVIGELETILERMENGGSVEQSLMKIFLEAGEDKEIRKRLEEWGDTFQKKREEVETSTEEREEWLHGSTIGQIVH